MRIHASQVPLPGGTVKARPRGLGARLLACGLSFAALLLLSGCDEGAPTSPLAGFGQLGEVIIEVRSPLGQALGGGEHQGTLHETLRWRSNGGWTLAERVSYRGVQGAETVRRSRLNPGQLTAEYTALILQLTETPGLRLFGAVSQGLFPICGAGLLSQLTSQVSVSIHDSTRNETVRWVRCTRGRLLASGPTAGINPESAGPDEPASRVITAATTVRFYTLGTEPQSTHAGTIPFATLAQGEHSPALPTFSRAFVSADGTPPQDFLAFWAQHAGAAAPLPEVAWGQEFVFLAAVGAREEAGDSVHVRRILPLGPGLGTQVEMVERIPGDFCSPLAKQSHPFHLVVVPSALFPIDFLTPQVERIPCGI